MLLDPNYVCYEYLQHKCAVKPNLYIFNAAVGTEVGNQVFFELPGYSEDSSLVPPE